MVDGGRVFGGEGFVGVVGDGFFGHHSLQFTLNFAENAIAIEDAYALQSSDTSSASAALTGCILSAR